MKAGRLNHSISVLLSLAFLAQGCMPAAESTRTVAGVDQQQPAVKPPPPILNPVSTTPKVEIRNLVEPNITTADYPSYFNGTGQPGAGTYVRKLTLPQNYAGFLYLGGLNISSLKNRQVRVRFTFGVSGTQKLVDAVVSRAPGITPSTDIDVLVMDLKTRPFNDVRLVYDLYDYKDYSLDANPVETNRDPNLYCRALKLQDDPTFNGQGACDGFAADGTSPLLDENGNQIAEKCLYSYAKVVDRGLAVRTGPTTFTETFPSLVQQDYTRTQIGYYAQTTRNILNRCLPDKSLDSDVLVVDGVEALTKVDNLFFSFFNEDKMLTQRDAGNVAVAADTFPVKYLGPFKPINTANWELGRDAVFGEFGLFDFIPGVFPAGTFAQQMDGLHLHRSKLFPRFTRLSLAKDVNYLETDFDDLNSKVPVKMAGNGTTGLMDGCSARASSNSYLGYNVASCNASGKIEILARDNNGVEVVVAESNEVVLQLVRGVEISTLGSDFLYTNYKTCQNSTQCGADECCYNKRCWNDSLVSQCTDEVSAQPNLGIGQVCANDLECSSMCCNRSTGTCAIHDSNLPEPVLCNKPQGQFCLAEEWCAKSDVTDCYLVDTTDPNDPTVPDCRQHCITRPAFGSCVNNKCAPPRPGLTVPTTFNPNATVLNCTGEVPMPDFGDN